MAPVPKTNSINHFTHPPHDLTKISTHEGYLCDGCRMPGGAGNRFRCHQCNFNLHEICGSCPFALASFMHPQHHLSLVVRKQGPRQNERVCDLCSNSVEGLFYRCKTCNFDLHPLCTRFPQHVRHVLHETHQLTLQTSSANGSCAVCSSVCSSWRYRCEACSFDIHIECVLSAVSNIGAASTSRSVPLLAPAPAPSRSPSPSPPPTPPQTSYPPPPRTAYPPSHFQIVRPQNLFEMKLMKMVFKLVANLTLGVVRNFLFGTGNYSYFN